MQKPALAGEPRNRFYSEPRIFDSIVTSVTMEVEEYESYTEDAMEQNFRIIEDYKHGNIQIDDVIDELGIEYTPPMTKYNQTFGITYEEPITVWDILPFYQKVVIGLDVVQSKEEFKRRHGFGTDEINDIVNLIDEGRIEIVLEGKPVQYAEAGMDYVEELLAFRPPIKQSGVSLEFARLFETQREELNKGWKELETVLDTIEEAPVFTGNVIEPIRSNLKKDYAILRLEQPDIAETILEQIQRDPNAGLYVLNAALDFIVHLPSNPVNDMTAWPRNFLDSYEMLFDLEDIDPAEIEFPGELGFQLMRERAPRAPTRWEALELIDEFEAHDLHEYMRDMNVAIEQEREEGVVDELDQISEIIDAVRDDVGSLSKRKRFTRAGLTVGFCAMGTAAGAAVVGPLGPAVGFAASLGFNYIDDTLGDPLAERIITTKSPYSLTTFQIEESLSSN